MILSLAGAQALGTVLPSINGDVTLGWTNNGMASWTTTTSKVGSSSVELYWPSTTDNGYADINTPEMTLNEVNTWSCWVKGINSSGGGQVMVADVSFYLGDAKKTVVHSAFLWGCNPPIDTWTQVNQASISVGSGIYSVRGISVSENLSSWASVISKYGSYDLSYVRLGMGNKGYTGSFTSYVDDFVLNGTTYVMEPLPEPPCMFVLAGDINDNCKVDFYDFALFATEWLAEGCDEPDWCGGADFDLSGDVTLIDLDELAQNWLIDCQANPSNPACVPK